MEHIEFKKYFAEMVGTFALVFIGCGSAVLAGQYIGFLGVAFAFGLVLMAMYYTISNISGCHINPAVTIGMLVAGNIDRKNALGYIIFQCIGAIIGAAILLTIAVGQPGYSLEVNGLWQNGYGEHSPGGYSVSAALIAEIVLTALLLIVFLQSISNHIPKGFAALSIGLTYVFIHLVGIPVTGTSVNPARSLGPALFAGSDAVIQLWLFWLAPIVGAIIGVTVWKMILEQR